MTHSAIAPFVLRALSLSALTFSLAPLVACSSDDGSVVQSQSEDLRRHHHWCIPKTCATAGVTCGTVADGCGGQLDCGVCPTDPTSTPTPAPTTTSTSPTPTPPPSSSSGFTLGQRPFAATSSWNTPIPSNATYTSLAWPASTGYNYWVNWDGYSPAIYVASSSDPVVQVSFPDSWGYPAQTIPIRLPSGVSGASGTDGELLAIDGTTIHNCWQLVRTSETTATCSAYARADAITSSGWGSSSPFLGAGIVATGSSQMAGLLVQAETDAGEIEHAIQIALDGALQKPGYSGEAISGDGSSASGIAQEGDRFAIAPGVSMPSGLSPLGQKVFRAMQNYGVFDIDVAGDTSTLRAQANAYDANTIDALRADVNKLIPMLNKVTF